MKHLSEFITESTIAEKWSAKAAKFLKGPKVKSLLSKYDKEFAEEVIDYIDGTLYSFLDDEDDSYDNINDYKNGLCDELEELEGIFDDLSEQYDIDFKEVAKIFKDIADLLRTLK